MTLLKKHCLFWSLSIVLIRFTSVFKRLSKNAGLDVCQRFLDTTRMKYWQVIALVWTSYTCISFHLCQNWKCIYAEFKRPFLGSLSSFSSSSSPAFFLRRDKRSNWWYNAKKNKSTNSTIVNTLAPNISPNWPPTSPEKIGK